MHGSPTETRFAGFWQTFTSVLAALARKGGGSLTDSPLPELRYAAREWDRASERREQK
jgi:hypothetical protein